MLLFPMIVLATVAAVIASQAVISGAFSVAREAIQLGFLPRMQIRHTSHETIGQIYLPWINRMLLVLTLAVVIGFQSSSNLAAAYGIAVVGTMTIDSILVMIVFRRMWNWSRGKVAAVGLLFLIVDLAFLTANADKVEHGGWFPLVLGIVVFTLMTTWRRGRELVMREVKQGGLALEPFIASISAHPPLRVPGTAIFLTANQDGVPNALLHNLKHNKVLHERNVILTVETRKRRWPSTTSAPRSNRSATASTSSACASGSPRTPTCRGLCRRSAIAACRSTSWTRPSSSAAKASSRRIAPAWRCGATACSRSCSATRSRPPRSSRSPAIA